jgi:hypothetical protein
LENLISFTLPYGLRDQSGVLHKNGAMRLATALDEIEPFSDVRAIKNPVYVNILLITRVLEYLGTVNPVTPEVVERLLAADFVFLQDLYIQINTGRGQIKYEDEIIETECPNCRHRFLISLSESNNT